MRTIDWIATRKELDAARVGCMGIIGRRHVHAILGGARAAHPRRHRQRLSEYVPRQHFQPVALHRQLRAGNSQLGRDVRRRRPDRAAAAIRRIGRARRHLPHRRQPRQLRPREEGLRSLRRRRPTAQETFNDAHSFYGKKGLPFLKQHLAG